MIYTLTHCKNEEERSQAIESFKDMVYQQCLSRMYEGRTYERKFPDSVNDIKINFSNAVDLICWYDKEQKLQDTIEASLSDNSKENDLKLCICEIVTDCIVNDEVDGLISNDDY